MCSVGFGFGVCGVCVFVCVWCVCVCCVCSVFGVVCACVCGECVFVLCVCLVGLCVVGVCVWEGPVICYDLYDTLGSTWLTQGLLNVDPILYQANSVATSTHI